MTSKIKNFIIKNKEHSTAIVRIGLALVILWFGINQAIDPNSFLGYLPPWAMPHPADIMHFPPIHIMHNSSIQTTAIIMTNGIFEIILGLLLLLGFYTRIVAFVIALHLLSITLTLGYNDVAIRDFGLTIMAVSLIFSGAGPISIDNKKKE